MQSHALAAVVRWLVAWPAHAPRVRPATLQLSPLLKHSQFLPHPGEIVRRRALLPCAAALAILQVLEPTDHLRATLRGANRCTRRDVADRWNWFVDRAPIVAVEKLVHHARGGLRGNWRRRLLGRRT